MTDAVPRWLIPGTLCDQQLFAACRASWDELGAGSGHAVPSEVADLHNLGPDPKAWLLGCLAQLPAQFDVMAFSLGGVLAMMLLELAPQRVRRLILVASNSQPGSLEHQKRVDAQRQLWREAGPRALAEQMLREAVPTKAQTPTLQACLQDMAEQTPYSSFLAQGQLNATRPDGLPALQRWPGALMFMSGRQDPWCHAQTQQRMRLARPDAAVHEFADAGHYIPLESPLELARRSQSFFTNPV